MSSTKATHTPSAVAATPHPEAAAAAVKALQSGGNAVDAACAAVLQSLDRRGGGFGVRGGGDGAGSLSGLRAGHR
jgi:gamma-glutamyltranspeptidase